MAFAVNSFRLASWIALRYLGDGKNEIGFVGRFALAGLVIGVSVLVIVLSVINGFQRELERNVLANLPQAKVEIFGGIRKEEVSLLSTLPDSGLTSMAPFIARSGLILGRDRILGISITGVEVESYQRVSSVFENLEVGVGASSPWSKFSIVLGARLAQKLAVMVGDKVTLLLPDDKASPTGALFRRKRFTVVDIFETATLQDTSHAYISLKDAKVLFREREAQGVHGKLENLFDPSMLWTFFNEHLGERAFNLTTWISSNGNLFRAIAVQKLTMFILLSFLIAVAAFNLVAGLMMIVEQRKSDIAILMSMGASSNFLKVLFCLIGLSLCLLGVFLGVSIGVLISLSLPWFYKFISDSFGLNLMSEYFITYLPVNIMGSDLTYILLVTMFIGLLSSLYPAHRAASLSPSQALSHE